MKTCSEYEHAKYFDDSQLLKIAGQWTYCNFSQSPEIGSFKRFPFKKEHNWFSVSSYQFSTSDSLMYNKQYRTTMKDYAETSKLCRQRFTLKCIGGFKLFGENTKTSFRSIYGVYTPKFPGATEPNTCPCNNNNTCDKKTVCNCNGATSTVYDDGYLSVESSVFRTSYSVSLPINLVKISERSSGSFLWNLKALECVEYSRTGILFSFDELGAATPNFPIDKQFSANYQSVRALAIVDGHRKAVKFLDDIGVELKSLTVEPIRCFNNLSDCVFGFSTSLWFRPSQITTFAELLMLNDTVNGYFIVYEHNRVTAEVQFNGKVWRITSFEFPVYQWISIMMTWHPSQDLQLYINNIDATSSDGRREGSDVQPKFSRSSHCPDKACVCLSKKMNGNFLGIDDLRISENYVYQEEDRDILFFKGQGDIYENLNGIVSLNDDIGWNWNTSQVREVEGILGKALELGKMSIAIMNECPVRLSLCRKGFSFSFWFKLSLNFKPFDFVQMGKVLTLSLVSPGNFSLTSAYLDEPVHLTSSIGIWTHLCFKMNMTSLSIMYNGKFLSNHQLNNFKSDKTSMDLILSGEELWLDEVYLHKKILGNSELRSLTSKNYENYFFTFDNESFEEPWNKVIQKKIGIEGNSIELGSPLKTNNTFSKKCLSSVWMCDNGLILSFWLKIENFPADEVISVIDIATMLHMVYFTKNESLFGKFLTEEKIFEFEFRARKIFWNHIGLTYSKLLNIDPQLYLNGDILDISLKQSANDRRTFGQSKIILGDSLAGSIRFDELYFRDNQPSNQTIVNDYGLFLIAYLTKT